MTRQYHIQLDDGECAPYVLLPGDPSRVEAIASTWDTWEKVAHNREYVSYRGTYQGMPISCTSTGIGGASTAIAMEELARVGCKGLPARGAPAVLSSLRSRMATWSSLIAPRGSTVLPRPMPPLEFPAVADHTLLQANIQAAEKLGVRYHVGCTRSHDGLYARHPEKDASFNNYWQSAWENHYQDLERMNILASEMEAGVVLTLARLWGLRAGGHGRLGHQHAASRGSPR